jgi:hypothetical protein
MIVPRLDAIRWLPVGILAATLAAVGCGGEEPTGPPSAREAAAPDATASDDAAAEADRAEADAPVTPDDLPNALVLALAQFGPREPGKAPKPLPATLEFLVRREGEWSVGLIEDPQSNVFHKAMVYRTPEGRARLLSAAGSEATLKLWTPGKDGSASETIWEQDFGGKFSRMRDIEVGDIDGDGTPVIAVATHDQGVVALVRPAEKGGFEVEEIDREPDTFVHEIELGDLDGDGVIEVYATPSEPNRLDGRPQQGMVTRYVPAKDEGRTVVADLGDRHAKEIYVDDVDGDGTDELYVVVEGVVEKGTQRLLEPVEIRRYDAGTDPKAGKVVATIDDRLGRFLTAGDFDGDGRKSLVAATFSAGVWLLRPGDDPENPGEGWSKELIDKDSGGFEHATIAADLDEDGRDELYVASDNDSEVRRYVWADGEFGREVIYRRTNGNSVFTWNIMPVPVDLVP